MFVVQQKYIGDQPEKLGRPIIVEEKEDTSVPTAYKLLGVCNVVRLYKVSVVRRDWFGLPNKRPHVWLLEKTVERKEPPPLSEKEIAKVQPGIHFGLFDRLRPLVDRARKRKDQCNWSNRPIDALFIGMTTHGTPALARHRLRFCESLQAIRGLNVICVPSRSLSFQDYMNISGQAKIIISPWGYGELCHRDFEAMLLDCVLVKPKTDFIDTLDNILKAGETYEPCQIDASDLEAVIRSILENQIYHEPELRRRNRERLLNWWQEEKFVDWWLDQAKSFI
jgi:hypothetical protein